MVTSTILCYFVPLDVERILCDLDPLLLFLQAPRCGNKPSAEVPLFQVRFRDDVCIFIRTVFLPRGGLMRFILGVAVFGRWIRTMFAVCSFIVLRRRGNVVVVSSGVDWTVIFSCAVIAVFAMEGLRAAPLTSALGLLLGGVILRYPVAIAFIGCVHHIYHMMRWLSSALWAVVLVRLLHHRPYRQRLRSRSRACRSNCRQWLLSGWWVGIEFLHRPHPSPARHSSARILLTRRETLMS